MPFSAKPSSLRARLLGTSGSLCDPPRPLAPQPHPSQAQGSHRDAAGAWLERHFSLEGVGPLPDLPGKPVGTAHPVPETWLLRERGMWPLELPLVPRRLGPGWRPLRTATENPATPPIPGPIQSPREQHSSHVGGTLPGQRPGSCRGRLLLPLTKKKISGHRKPMRYLGKKMTFNVSMRTCVSPTNRPSPGSLAALCRPPLPEGAQPPDPRSMVPLQKYDKIQNLKLW